MNTQEICWYTRRNELEQGQVFRCQGGVVELDGRVAGDGTKWTVLDWHEGWCSCSSEIEPGDLEGVPMQDDGAVIAAALAEKPASTSEPVEPCAPE
jgi:hypothetical protein